MQVLLINQFFWPDTAATAQLLTDVTREIDPDLHPMTVLCGSSVYGEVDSASAPPVKIVQCGRAAFSRGKIGRIVSYASFFAGAALHGLRDTRPALVVTLTTPPLISLVGTFLKTFRGSRHFIWEMDLYPDIAADLNVMKPQSLVTRFLEALANGSRRRADGIIALGEDMKARLMARGVPEHKIVVAENWADGDEIVPGSFPEGPLVVHYSGTFGLAHEHHTIKHTVRALRGDDRFRFVFVGGGARRATLEEFCRTERLTNAEFRPYAGRNELGKSLAEGHLGLVTQLPQTTGAIVPSKTYGIMAAGRPILYVGPQDATPSQLLLRHECGWRVEPGDVEGMVQLLKRLDQDRGVLRDAGARARCAFEKYYARPIGVARILSILGLAVNACPISASCAEASTV